MEGIICHKSNNPVLQRLDNHHCRDRLYRILRSLSICTALRIMRLGDTERRMSCSLFISFQLVLESFISFYAKNGQASILTYFCQSEKYGPKDALGRHADG